jgi:hypothetical protein
MHILDHKQSILTGGHQIADFRRALSDDAVERGDNVLEGL